MIFKIQAPAIRGFFYPQVDAINDIVVYLPKVNTL
jgi:hypothetical protein